MPLIQTISPEEATGELAGLYETITRMRGRVGNNARLFSISPELLKQQMAFIGHYMKHPTLSMPLLASIRVLVSSGVDCAFCIGYNKAMLINMVGWTPEQVEAMRTDPAQANLPERDKAMLAFVLKGVKNAHAVEAADIAALRGLGWSDGDILDALNHGTRMLATDILFNAFKIEEDF